MKKLTIFFVFLILGLFLISSVSASTSKITKWGATVLEQMIISQNLEMNY